MIYLYALYRTQRDLSFAIYIIIWIWDTPYNLLYILKIILQKNYEKNPLIIRVNGCVYVYGLF